MDGHLSISANGKQTSDGGCLLNVADGEDAPVRENMHNTCKSCGESQTGSPRQTYKKRKKKKRKTKKEQFKRDNNLVAFDYSKYYERVNKWNEKRRAYTKTENYEVEKKETSKVWKTKGSERAGKKKQKRKYEVSQCLSIHQRKNNRTGGNEKDLCGPKGRGDLLSKLAKEGRSRVKSHSSCSSDNCGEGNNQAGKGKKSGPPCGNNDNHQEGLVDEDDGRNEKEEAQTNEWTNEESNPDNPTHDPLMVKHEDNSFSPFICPSERKRHAQDRVGETSDMHINARSNETIVENEDKMAYSNRTIADSFDDVVSLSLRASNGDNLDDSKFSGDHFEGDHANWNHLHGDYQNLLRNPTVLMKPKEPNRHMCGPPLEQPNGYMIGRHTEKDMVKERTKRTEKGTPKTNIYNERFQFEVRDPNRNSHEEDILSRPLKMHDPFCTHNGGNNWDHSSVCPNTFASYYQPNGAPPEGIYKGIYKGIDKESHGSSCDRLRSRFSDFYYKWPPLSIKNPFAFIYKSAKFFGLVQEAYRKRTTREAQPHTTTTINVYAKRKKIYTKEEHISKLDISKKDLLFNFEMDNLNSSENSSLQIWEGSTSKVKGAVPTYSWRENKISRDFTKQFGITPPQQESLLRRLSGVEELHTCDTDEEGIKEDRKRPIMSMVQSAPEAEEQVNLPGRHKTDEEEKEEKPMNKHKQLIDVGKKDTNRNFDIFLSLFMKHEKKEEFLFCLICDEELTENSIFFQNCIKPMLDEYRKSKFEKVKKEKNTSPDVSLSDIHINKIILEIMIPSIKKKYLKYVSGLYDKKEPTPNNDINASDELQKEVLEINQKMENLNIKSLDKHSTDVYIKEASRYEKKIKLIEKPKWSNEQNLKKLLLKQQNYNPFTIFGTSIKEVHLEEVFTLDVYNNYVTNEDRFRNKILYDLYVGKYIQNLYHKIDYQEWTFVLDSLKKQWKYFTNLECNMFLDPLLLEEILWYIDENKMYKDKSEEMYTYEYCFCPTPDPTKEMNLNDVKHFATSMAERYTLHQDVKYKKLSLNEESFSPHKTLILKYDDVSVDQDILTFAGRQKEKLTKEALLFNVPRPSSTFYYDSDFFENKIKKHMFRKKVKRCKGNLDVNSPSGKEEEPFTIKYKSKKWTSQKFFDNFFSNYYLYNFDRMDSFPDYIPSLMPEHSGCDINVIHFSEPYHKITKQEQREDPELKRVLAQNIYDNVKNSITYLEQTQYNPCECNHCRSDIADATLEDKKLRNNVSTAQLGYKKECPKACVEDREIIPNRLQSISAVEGKTSLHPKTYNILKNHKDSLEIHQSIPPLMCESFAEFTPRSSPHQKNQRLPEEEDNMNNHRYGEYSPMNGFGYNHHNTMNPNGFCTNTYNRELPNLTMQQHNMHGRNNLMFEDGNIPYGLYGQSNYTGTNSLTYGGGTPSHDPKMMYRRNHETNEPFYNHSPMGSGMGYNTPFLPPQAYYPSMKRNLTKEGYTHGYHYMNNANNNGALTKYPSESVADKGSKKESCRKNLSKVKKGDIDINIETSSSGRKGVIIDLNIGVGN
ncbi:hypothetical protein AK88_03499 [Plasmodium fragile]|uniref:Inner centromere protein ARK-binding domain-containing protein n=1 Tax=Plasmodium fragile TaxID=5857 RepID=A0A0D9QMC3_PLAFR|nr:uncharacterized protein AK88_03499 [Plasmodium fragile]KJP86886.1 hypothetical protein AK88_03499 [Plasmodium fragile]